MTKLTTRILPLGVMLALISGCTSVTSNLAPEMKTARSDRVYACHGFNCTFKTRVDITPADADAFASFFANADSPAAEREGIARAIAYFEEKSAAAIGVRDGPKSTLVQSGAKGQMDCIDESTNTRSMMMHLAARGLITRHTVEMNVSRGFLLDARYFHSTGVIRDESGKRWAVDSWYEPAGGRPDIMPLDEWMTRGVMGER